MEIAAAVSTLNAAQESRFNKGNAFVRKYVGAAAIINAEQETVIQRQNLFGSASVRLDYTQQRAIQAEKALSSAESALRIAERAEYQAKELLSNLKVEVSEALSVESLANANLDKILGDIISVVELVNSLTLEIKNHAISATYAPLLHGLALIGLQSIRAYLAWYQATDGEKSLVNKYQKLMELYPEGVLNNYFNCGFGDEISVTNEQIIKAVLNYQCSRTARTENVINTDCAVPAHPDQQLFTITRTDNIYAVELTGEYHSEPLLNTTEAY